MIHVKAIIVGCIFLAMIVGAIFILAKWPTIAGCFILLGVTYMLGRGILEFVPKRS